MYNGKNPSALRSMQWISDALLSLMAEKDFNSISVKEITAWCDLSRQTFYKIFNSKEEILEYLLDTLFSDFKSQIEMRQIHSVKELALLYFSFYEQNKDFIDLLFKNQLSLILINRLKSYLPALKVTLKGSEHTALDSFAEVFIAYGLVGILERFGTVGGVAAEELAVMLENLLNCR